MIIKSNQANHQCILHGKTFLNSKYLWIFQQLLEKAEAREKERVKEETRKV